VSGLAGARLYLVAPAQLVAGRLEDLVGELGDAGVDLVQLREKTMEGGDILRVGEPIAAACRQAGVPFIVNDRPDVALALGADGVHLGRGDVPAWVARRILADGLVGRSTHSEEDIEAELAAEPAPDYISVGPVRPTPTKPGRPGTGLELVRFAATRVSLPWFVTGGVAPQTIADVIGAGARRAVVVRAITQAADPVGVAAKLKAQLNSAPLEPVA
jgi:thiamine-phosphate pyrophosphorylase